MIARAEPGRGHSGAGWRADGHRHRRLLGAVVQPVVAGVRLGLGALLLVTTGCATTLAPLPAGEGTRSLAGTWHGRLLGPLGHATASMTVREDGTYTGTMFLDVGDREFNGVIIAVAPGRARYQGTDGNGTVRLREQHGRRVLRFVPDGGGAGGTFVADP
jgi:hypothetical protein